jgi:hypothetical protein
MMFLYVSRDGSVATQRKVTTSIQGLEESTRVIWSPAAFRAPSLLGLASVVLSPVRVKLLFCPSMYLVKFSFYDRTEGAY